MSGSNTPACDGALRLAAKPACDPPGLLSVGLLACDSSSIAIRRCAVRLHCWGALRQRPSRNTLAASVVRVGRRPIINLMRDHLLEAPVTHGDRFRCSRSRVKSAVQELHVGADDARQRLTVPGRQWLFGYAASRSTAAAQTLYAGIPVGSVLMTDGMRCATRLPVHTNWCI